MQQIINNIFKKVGSLDLAHKAFLSLFLLNVFLWSGLTEGPKTVNLKPQLVCDGAEWHSPASQEEFSFELPSFVVFGVQGSQRPSSLFKSKLKSKVDSKFSSFANQSKFLYFASWHECLLEVLKSKIYILKNNPLSLVYYFSSPLRGPPLLSHRRL